ncbi:MAG: hypothetical protein E3J87_10290 [Candidatus Cloacimonadota bacterium]|nr:MAG: hypothetical protein E3J87_10290 [Candidatus Cloacimonadota bacterium]
MKKEGSEIWALKHPLNFNKYRGEYLALVNDRIVAHGKKFEEVYNEAIKFDKEPVFTKIPESEIMIL